MCYSILKETSQLFIYVKGKIMAKSKLIKELANGKVDLVTAFNRLLIIANDIENDELVNWAENELNGYKKAEDLPEYRKIYAPYLQYTGINGRFQVTNVSLPHNYLSKESLNAIINVNVFESVKELEKYSQLSESVHRDLTNFAGEVLERTRGVRCISIRQIINTQQYTGVLSNIQTKLIRVLLKIDKEYGDFDDLDISIAARAPSDLQTVNIQINKLIYGDHSVKIGDNNDISKSSITSGVE